MTVKKTIRDFFVNDKGDVVIWQVPNFLLWLWITIKFIPLIIHNQRIKTDLSQLSQAVLFAWAYLEIMEGDSKFRKALGIIVMIVTVASIFK